MERTWGGGGDDGGGSVGPDADEVEERAEDCNEGEVIKVGSFAVEHQQIVKWVWTSHRIQSKPNQSPLNEKECSLCVSIYLYIKREKEKK